jgi:hypothetical protein
MAGLPVVPGFGEGFTGVRLFFSIQSQYSVAVAVAGGSSHPELDSGSLSGGTIAKKKRISIFCFFHRKLKIMIRLPHRLMFLSRIR